MLLDPRREVQAAEHGTRRESTRRWGPVRRGRNGLRRIIVMLAGAHILPRAEQQRDAQQQDHGDEVACPWRKIARDFDAAVSSFGRLFEPLRNRQADESQWANDREAACTEHGVGEIDQWGCEGVVSHHSGNLGVLLDEYLDFAGQLCTFGG